MRATVKRLAELPAGAPVPVADVRAAMEEILTGRATDAQTAAFATILRARGETPEIVAACCEALQRHALACDVRDAVDIVGTGGDGLDTFNVSTCAGVVAAACGLRVVKHGNRAASSLCGSADVLEALGAKMNITPPDVSHIVDACGFCFVFAQRFQPALRHAARVRREIGFRTVFNILGPLSNPAQPRAILAGVYSEQLGQLVAETFQLQGMRRAIVVCGHDGLDEISPYGATTVWSLQDGSIARSTVHPTDFGLPVHTLEAVKGGDPAFNSTVFRAVLADKPGPYRDWVVLNAGALLFVAGAAATIVEGVAQARAALASGKARGVLEQYVRLSSEAASITGGLE